MSLRSKHHRQERVARLHRRALDHIARDGVQGLRMSALAKDLGYTTAALYRYYPSREALIAALQSDTLSRLRSALIAVIDQAQMPSPLGNLLLSGHFYAQYAQRSPASFALNSSIFTNPTLFLPEERRQETLPMMQGLLELIAGWLTEAGLAAGSEPLSLALSYWSGLHGVLLTQKYHADFPLPDPRQFAGTLCLGWGADSAEVARAQELISSREQLNGLSPLTSLDELNPLDGSAHLDTQDPS